MGWCLDLATPSAFRQPNLRTDAPSADIPNQDDELTIVSRVESVPRDWLASRPVSNEESVGTDSDQLIAASVNPVNQETSNESRLSADKEKQTELD